MLNNELELIIAIGTNVWKLKSLHAKTMWIEQGKKMIWF